MNVILREGDRGSDVINLQVLLKAAGIPIEIDGMFGPLTEDAVKYFQSRNDLETDGIAGPITLSALDTDWANLNNRRKSRADSGLRDTIADISQHDMGQKELKSNDSPRIREMLKRVGINYPAAYCMAAVYTWVYEAHVKCGFIAHLPKIPKTAGVMNFWQLCPKEWRVGKLDGKRGDIIVYDHGKGKGHIGVVDGYSNGFYLTNEGNAQPLTAKVLTPTGWKTMGDMKVGDALVEPSGLESEVVGVFPKGNRPVYKVTLIDGSSTEACDEHLWNYQEGKIHNRIGSTMDLKQRVDSNARVSLPAVKPIEFHQQGLLPVQPYVLGVLLGDGYINDAGNVRLTCNDQEIVDKLVSGGVHVSDELLNDPAKAKEFRVNGLQGILKELGVAGCRSYEKFIPHEYKFASVEDRIELLRGLMDTDGTVDNIGRMAFSSSSKQLATDVQELVRSLGGRVAVNNRTNVYYTSPTQKTKKRGRDSFRVQNIRLPDINPFYLSRKADKVKPRIDCFGNTVVSVEFLRNDEVQCIAVSASSRLYVTDDYIVTHNTNAAGSREGEGFFDKKRSKYNDPKLLGFIRIPDPEVAS